MVQNNTDENKDKKEDDLSAILSRYLYELIRTQQLQNGGAQASHR